MDKVAVRALIRPLLLTVVVLAASLYVRLKFIEPSHIAFACQPDPWSGWCAARSLLIQTFAHNGLGWAALVLAALAWFTRAPVPAYLALLVGLVGLVFYCYEFAVVGVVAGLLVLVRHLTQR